LKGNFVYSPGVPETIEALNNDAWLTKIAGGENKKIGARRS